MGYGGVHSRRFVLIGNYASSYIDSRRGTAQKSLGYPTPLPSPGANPLTTVIPETTIVRKVS